MFWKSVSVVVGIAVIILLSILWMNYLDENMIVGMMTDNYIRKAARGTDSRTPEEFILSVLQSRKDEREEKILLKIEMHAMMSEEHMPFEGEKDVARKLLDCLERGNNE